MHPAKPSRLRLALIAATGAALMAGASAAHASSDAAWDKMRADMEKACSDGASDILKKPRVAVDPTGTESFGVAIVYGKLKGAEGRASIICVMDKKTGKVELGSELSTEIIRVAKGRSKDAAGGAAEDDGEE